MLSNQILSRILFRQMADECSEVSSYHSKLPSTFQIPIGYAVISRQNESLNFSEDVDSFFKSYATEWSKLSPYENSKPGSKMSEFIDAVVAKGISHTTVSSRCINVRIKDTLHFGILNSLINPFGSEAVMPSSMNRQISFVLLLTHGKIHNKFDEMVDLLVRVLQVVLKKCNFSIEFIV
jgi:hypothetical protein